MKRAVCFLVLAMVAGWMAVAAPGQSGPGALAPWTGAAAMTGSSGGAGGTNSEALKNAAKAELEKRIKEAVKSAMNTALDEARARGGSSWDAAAKIANAQGMEQLYAQEVQDAANVGLVFYTEGFEDARDLRLAQLSRDGLSKAVLGYVSNAYPPLGVVLAVYDALKALFSFDFSLSSVTAHQRRDFKYDEIRDQVIASNDSVLQTQYINLQTLWLTYRSLNGLGPTTALNPWNMVPHSPVTFDDVFQACLRKKGAYDTNMWGDGSSRSFEFNPPAWGFWYARWIGWPEDPDDDDLAFYAEQVTAAYAAFKMAPLNEASNNFVELIFGSIAMDLRIKEEEEAARKAKEEAARKAKEKADQKSEANSRATADCQKIEKCKEAVGGVVIRTQIGLGLVGFGRRVPGDREALFLSRISEVNDDMLRIAKEAPKALEGVRSANSSSALMWACVAVCTTYRTAAEFAAAEAERYERAIASAKKHDQEEKARIQARLAGGIGVHGKSKALGKTVHLVSGKVPGTKPKSSKVIVPKVPAAPKQKK